MPFIPKSKVWLLALFLFFPASLLQAKEIPFTVLPWNGYKAALSLTYDDGQPIHLDYVIPQMEKRGLKGTFYLIAGSLTRVEDWKKAAEEGQEIGNHTMTHRHVNELTPADEKNEVVGAKEKLEKLLGVSVLTLAYPYVEISPGLLKWVKAEEFAARGGGGYAYLTPDMDPDWYNLPSQIAMSSYAYQTYQDWVDQDLSAGAWTVLMIHAIEPADWYQPLRRDTYLKLLDYLVKNKKVLWTAPFGQVAAYWRAQKTLEAAEPQRDGDKTLLKWEKPDNFPEHVMLKVRIEGKRLKVMQDGKELKPYSGDLYKVSFDAKELTLVNAAWHAEGPQATATPITVKPPVIDSLFITAPPSRDALKLDDFESSSPQYGGGWWEGCDSNGVTKLSPVPFAALPGGSPLSPGHSAGMKGRMGPLQAPWPWALLSLNLNANNAPEDLSAYKALRFYTKGDGKSHLVALNKASVTDYCDYQASFVSPSKWTQVTVPFAQFAQPNWGKQVEKSFKDVTKLTFSPGTDSPDFDFRIDDVEFLKEVPAGAGKTAP